MIERIIYYWIYDKTTKERKMEVSDTFCGDIGEPFNGDPNRIVEDYAIEIEDLEMYNNEDEYGIHYE